MKILWLPHLPWARMEGQREWHLVKRLLARGHEIHVLTWEAIGELGALLRTLGSRTGHDGALTIHRAPRLPNPVGRITRDYSRGFPPNEWLFRRHVRRILADERIDLFVYGLSHKAVGLPPFDVAVPRVFDYLDLCLYPGVEDAYLANSDLVLCTSTVLVERVRARGVRAAYLPNGVDRGRLASGKAEAVRRALGLTGKRVVSLIGLTCSPTLFFVDAIARARREMPDIVFLAVGAAGWLPREGLSPFAARCRQLGVPLVATGPVPNAAVADYFMATDVGLYPGDANPYFDAACPIKVLEYSAAGKPVVATDLEELRRFGWPNVFLEPPEPAAFAAGIVRAFSEHPPMPDLASFDWDVLAARFEESCEALLSERASTRAASAQVRRGEVLDERPVPSSPV
ncbi:MAG: glycosyltransferase family 4 protein [Chloroflexi bacterium]|nr:MAG: glycosyltransferase family 4 protein [Chloroflexota bacterium]